MSRAGCLLPPPTPGQVVLSLTTMIWALSSTGKQEAGGWATKRLWKAFIAHAVTSWGGKEVQRLSTFALPSLSADFQSKKTRLLTTVFHPGS